MTAPIAVGLSAVIVAADDEAPYALATRHENGESGLPHGSFDPEGHRTFELGLRDWVRAQMPDLWVKMHKEVAAIRFVLSEKGWSNVDIDLDSLEQWSEFEYALLTCLSNRMLEGEFIDDALALAGEMDRRIGVRRIFAVGARQEARKG